MQHMAKQAIHRPLFIEGGKKPLPLLGGKVKALTARAKKPHFGGYFSGH
jgi:hypothetical protein